MWRGGSRIAAGRWLRWVRARRSAWQARQGLWTTELVIDCGRGLRLNGVIGWTWNWRHVWTGYWCVNTGSRRSLCIRDIWRRSRDRRRNLCPTAVAFPLTLSFDLSIRADTIVSIRNTSCRSTYSLQAQSKSIQKVSVAIHVEILHAETLDNNISRLEKGDAVSDGHVLQQDLVCLGLRLSMGRLLHSRMTYLEAEGRIFEIKLWDFSVLYRIQCYCPITELELQH